MPNEVLIHVRGKDDASAVIGGVKKSATGLGSALGDVAKIAGGIIVSQALSKLPELLTSALSATTSLASGVRKLSRETGLTAEESSKLIDAFDKFNLTSDDASRSLGILAKKLKGVQDEETGVTTGGKSTAAILADLGIKALDATGNLVPMGQLIPQIADVFKSMPDGIEKTGLAMQLFGRSGKDMIPVLNMGAEGLRQEGIEAERFGIVLDEKAVVAARNLAFAQDDLGDSMQGLKIVIGTALIPAMTGLAIKATDVLVAIRPLIQDGIDKLTGSLDDLETALKKVDWDTLGDDAKKVLGDALKPLGNELKELQNSLGDLGESLGLAGRALSKTGIDASGITGPITMLIKIALMPLMVFINEGIAILNLFSDLLAGRWKAALIDFGITALAPFRAGWISVRDVVASVMVDIVKATEWGLNKAIDIINAFSIQANRFLSKVGKELPIISHLDIDTSGLESFISTLGGVEGAAGLALSEVDPALRMAIENSGKAGAEAGPSLDAYGAAAGGAAEGAEAAAAGAEAAAKAALEVATVYQILVGSMLLYKLETGAATVAEAEMTNTLLSGLGVHVERQNLIKAEIGTLEDFCKAEEKAGRGEGIAAQAAQATIEKLQAEADALDIVTDRWILFGEKGLSPIGAAINEITDAIGRQTSGLSSLMGVETQEEADLIARIANYDAQIAGLEAVTAATEALTQAEQDRLGVARSRSTSGNAEIEQIEDYMSIITEMERRKRENGRLTQKEQQAYADALRKLNALEKEQWTISNVHEKAQERIWDLQQETESSEETASSLEALAKKRTDEGKAAIDALEAERDPLQKALDAINAKKTAEEKGLEAKVKGRPTMEDWTRLLVGEAIAQGLVTTGILDQIPALAAWAKEHGQDCFNIAKGLQLLEIEQDDFLRANQADVDAWANSWALAAAAVLASMASIASAESPGISSAAGGSADVIARGMQWGGIVTRPTLALLAEHGTEAVIPLGRGGISAGATNVYVTVMGSIRSERDLEKVIADALRHGKFRGLVAA